MSTSSSVTSATLYDNESKSVVLPGNISPIVESSSTATLESTTAQVSSKSSSPLSTSNVKETKTVQLSLSPLSASYVSSPVVTQLSPSSGALFSSTSTFSTNRFSPKSYVLNDSLSRQRNCFGPLKIEVHSEIEGDKILREEYICENMLTSSGTTTSIGQRTPPTNTTTSGTAAASSSNSPVATSCSSTLSPAATIGCHMNNNSVQNIKCEPHLTTSPNGGVISSDNSSTQRQHDDAANKNTTTSDNSVHRDGSTIQRKNSNSSVISGVSGAGVHTSPSSSNHNNDNSNSSNSTISQTVDADANNSAQPQQSQEPNVNSATKIVSQTNSVDDGNDDSASGTFQNAGISKENSSSSTSSSSSASSVSIKEDSDMHSVLNNLVNVKKEQTSVDTPEMSPDGFGSLPTLTGNNTVSATGAGVTSGTSSNINEMINNTGNQNNVLGSNNNSKSSNVMGAGSGISGCNTTLHNDGLSNGQQSINNNFGGNVPVIPNSMDYMQQQNHIFVFSTQLANKGAESVLNGQFPTIIAYHCTQPATKKFLEDFFLKNPMKMAKIQRQNSLNMSITVSTGHQWMGAGNTMAGKHSQKSHSRTVMGPTNNAVNSQICNAVGIDEKSTSSALNTASTSGFPDASDSLPGETDLMNWEQSNIGLENIANNAIKIGEGSDSIVSPHNLSVGSSTIPQQSPIKSIGISAPPGSPGDNMQPSLQGVKVPDENLTPQQRQHREEQLAKLKKMNQFLFPEHGSDLIADSNVLQVSNQLGKINSDGMISNTVSSGNLVGILGDGNNTSSISGGNQITNARAANNIIAMGRGSNAMARPSVNLGSGSSEDGISTSIIGGGSDMSNIHCGNQTIPGNLIINSQPGIPCGPGGMLGTIGPNSMVGGIGSHGSGQGGILPHNNIIPGMNSLNNCGANGPPGSILLQGGPPKGMTGANQMDVGGGPPSQMEWAKIQHQFYEERKGTKGGSDIITGISGLCRSISSVGGSYVRSSQPGPGVTTSSISGSGPSGRSQGPPPPYHPTQRSASVPIATQSPNPSSPNNPTSNLSLPSPRTASATTLNSPSSDALVSSSSVTTSTTSTATTLAISTTSNTSNQCKAFQLDDSNSNNHSSGNCNLRNNMNQFNSNPSTPLSNMSPKDLENLGSSGITGDVKNPRPSPQRSRTPHVTGGNNTEQTNIEGRFPPASPGVNFPPHMQNQSGGPKISSGSTDNQNSGPATFGRRPDNLPLNPNSSRPPPIKQNHHFDPISSLAQMSQQLTSCVSSNGGVNGPSSVGIATSMSNEMPLGSAGNQNIDGHMGPSADTGMEHCNNVSGNSGGMGIPPHMLGAQYGQGGCHMSGAIINPMNSRMLGPKMGGGFSGGPAVMRDGPAGFHGGIPPHRMMGRMGVNFCPFNGSSNIQVKASTPNTIQYMPVRPQTNNTNPRVPPSLEFLQRFANPQLSGGSNINEPTMLGSGASADPNKMPNSSSNSNMQNPGMNFFHNCNQLGTGNNTGNVSGGNPVEMQGVMMGNHGDMGGVMNMGNNPPGGMNIRAMRPVRQGSMGPGGSPIGGNLRMQGSGSHILGTQGGINQFGNNSQEGLECGNPNDPSGMFGNNSGGSNEIFGTQQKSSPMAGQSHCQNISTTNVGMNGSLGNTVIGVNEQNAPMQGQINGPGMIGPTGNGVSGPIVSAPGAVSGSPSNGSGSYKSYMGPSTNDLKYAQQYHNFQQQLYATSTRSQVNQQMGGSPAMSLPGSVINTGLPTNSNPGFFVNK